MKKYALNKRITLLVLEPQSCSRELAVTSRKTIWAKVSDVGVTTKLAALSTGQTVELCVIARRAECVGATHAEISGKRYKIIDSGTINGDMFVKLLLERDRNGHY